MGLTHSARIGEAEFSGLLQALSSSSKGQAFLAEYLRRYRPTETRNLLGALQRIEATVRILRDQVQPERLGSELRRIASTLEIAIEDSRNGSPSDVQRRSALLARASADLSALADSLSAEGNDGDALDALPPMMPRDGIGQGRPAEMDLIENDLTFLDQVGNTAASSVER